jgi:hypothetical protein
MWQWRIVYDGDQRAEDRKIGPKAYETTRARFREAADANALDGRTLAGMWILDLESEQEDVILLHGRAPNDVHTRHARFKEKPPR